MSQQVKEPTDPGEHREAGDAATAGANRAQMLLDFLRQNPAACPVCDYNLQGLTRPICPECGQELVLTVGVLHPRLAWLFIALAPGFFSGIAAIFTLVPILGRLLLGDGEWMPLIAAIDLFGFCSGAFAIILAVKRNRFIAQPRTRQRWFAIIIWLIHIAALGLFMLIGALFF